MTDRNRPTLSELDRRAGTSFYGKDGANNRDPAQEGIDAAARDARETKMRNEIPWTHYVNENRADGFVHAFTVGNCETCDEKIEEPNPVGLEGVVAIRNGLVQLPERLSEIGHNEETGISDCENCRGLSPAARAIVRSARVEKVLGVLTYGQCADLLLDNLGRTR